MPGRLELVDDRESGSRGTARAAGPRTRSVEDQQRLERMFVAYHAAVWRLARRAGLAPDAAADVVQQTFMVAIERLHDIRPESERSFLVGTAVRLVRASQRKGRTWELDPDIGDHVSNEGAASDDRSIVELCDLALSKIDRDLAEAFVLFEIVGLSSPEIAETLNIPRGTVASRIRRAREQFQSLVKRLKTTFLREGRP